MHAEVYSTSQSRHRTSKWMGGLLSCRPIMTNNSPFNIQKEFVAVSSFLMCVRVKQDGPHAESFSNTLDSLQNLGRLSVEAIGGDTQARIPFPSTISWLSFTSHQRRKTRWHETKTFPPLKDAPREQMPPPLRGEHSACSQRERKKQERLSVLGESGVFGVSHSTG